MGDKYQNTRTKKKKNEDYNTYSTLNLINIATDDYII